MEIKPINDTISVSGQVSPADMAEIKAAGFAAVINNRPDGEAPDQPAGAALEAAAKAAGLAYHAIPMGREGVSPAMVEKTRAVLDGAGGPVFAFCRSGTRSTTLWALSQAGAMPPETIISQASHAGYDMSHLAGHLDKPAP